jgi:benzylsuccinate CoA-transferase BbsF subunit
VSVAGQQGPYHETRAYAFNLHALSGLCSLIGYTGDTEPRHIDIAYADWNAGMFTTYAILLALYHRRGTGEGQFIDVSAWEATTTLLTEGILDYTLNGRVPGPEYGDRGIISVDTMAIRTSIEKSAGVLSPSR